MRVPALFLLLAAAATAAPRAGHVIVVSIDGANCELVQKAEMPNLDRLVVEGAHTWRARTIIPSKTLPSHTSMLTGLDIARHQIDWNEYFPLRGLVKTPTVFSLAKQAGIENITGLFCGKIKFRHLWLKDSLNVFDCGGEYDYGPIPAEEEKKLVPAAEVARRAAAWIVERKPRLCFIHLPDVDINGHKHGWGSDEQMEAFKACDQALGRVIEAVGKAGIAEDTTVIITADHGGKDKSHSDPIPNNTRIPWIAWGKGVRKGSEITGREPMTYDTAATVLWLLDIPAPDPLDGRPVTEAFDE
ncbi:MAG TPA: phosphodiesterase [Verrucomicrobiales bacterium]|nr:phosphodiesterase [Verrucomicrobiales bacterium]HRJ10287.1 alkaline phosphatase family protein [Prosthecobacter sp.]HRK16019.1 alkaline phosphatase family protein [Prosthecobacter sp.]